MTARRGEAPARHPVIWSGGGAVSAHRICFSGTGTGTALLNEYTRSFRCYRFGCTQLSWAISSGSYWAGSSPGSLDTAPIAMDAGPNAPLSFSFVPYQSGTLAIGPYLSLTLTE